MEILDRARAYTAAVPGAISGSRGQDRTLELACNLTWGFGLDNETALSLMLEWNQTCKPVWQERDLRRKISESRGRIDHRKPFGHLLKAGNRSYASSRLRKAQVAPPAETATWKIKRRSAESRQLAQPTPLTKPASLGTDGDAPNWPALVPVPGCKVGRPPEIEMDDTDWQALGASGFASEPLVQLAAWMFGPGCTVVDETRQAAL